MRFLVRYSLCFAGDRGKLNRKGKLDQPSPKPVAKSGLRSQGAYKAGTKGIISDPIRKNALISESVKGQA